MRLFKVTAYISSIMLILLGIFIWLIADMHITPIDMVRVNEIVHKATTNWDTKAFSTLDSYMIEFTLVDTSGQIVYQTPKHQIRSQHDGIKNGDIVIQLQDNVSNRELGKLILKNPSAMQLENIRLKVTLYSVLFIISIIVVLGYYAMLIQKRIIRPFSRLKQFSMDIARGNFDVALPMDQDNVFGAFTESFDIMREELMRARENERLANQSKKELVASLSHDIKTPIASILAISEVMLLRVQTREEKEKLKTIITKAEQMNALISDMFHATLEELQSLCVVVKEISSDVLRQIIHDADYKGIIHIGDIPECVILCDPLRLQQVMDNIVNNAYKYGEPPFAVQVELLTQQLQITFIDHGSGVMEDELAQIFKKFYRGENATSQSGAGLGLYISHYLVTQMEGQITARNLPNGFEVVVVLQLA